MTPELMAFAREFGIPATVIILLAFGLVMLGMAVAKRMNSTSKQDDTITNLLNGVNEERKASQERERLQQISINHLSAELTDLKSKQSYESGRNTEIKEAMERERAEWKAERSVTDNNIREMQTSILDLQKNQRDNQAKIRELEGQIDTLNKRIVNQDGEIIALRTTISQLETEKTQLLELNTELRRQVDERSARVENLSQLVKLGNEAETPPTLPTAPVSTANTQAIPDMRSVDDTFIPPLPPATFPQAGTPATPLPSEPTTETKPPAAA